MVGNKAWPRVYFNYRLTDFINNGPRKNYSHEMKDESGGVKINK